MTPETLPQGHNPVLMPSLGATFSLTSYLLVLNELSIPIVFVGLFASSILRLPRETVETFASAGRALAENISGVNIIDGYPRLKDEALEELQQLLQQASEHDRPLLRKAILRMAELSSTIRTVEDKQ